MSEMKLFVANLSFNTTTEDLRAAFVEAGYSPTDVAVLTERETGRSRGFGFVTLADRETGEAAMEDFNGATFMGRDLRVNEARPKERRGDENDRNRTASR